MKNKEIGVLVFIMMILSCSVSVLAVIPEFSVSTNNVWAGATNSIYDLTVISFNQTTSNKNIYITVPAGYDIYVPAIPGYVVGDYSTEVWNGTSYNLVGAPVNITVISSNLLNASGNALISISPNHLNYSYSVVPASTNQNTSRVISSFYRGVINNPSAPGQYNWDANVTFAFGGSWPVNMPGNKVVYLLGQTTVMNFNTSYSNTYYNFTVTSYINNNLTIVLFNSNNVTVYIRQNTTNVFNNAFSSFFNLTFGNTFTNLFTNQFNSTINIFTNQSFSNFFTNAFNTNVSVASYNNITLINTHNYNFTITDSSTSIFNNYYNFSLVSSPKFNITFNIPFNTWNNYSFAFVSNPKFNLTFFTWNNNTIKVYHNITQILSNAFNLNFSNSFMNMFTNHFNFTTRFSSNTSIYVRNNMTAYFRSNTTNIFNNRFNFSIVAGSVTNNNRFNVTMHGTTCPSITIPACPAQASCPAIPACPSFNVTPVFNIPPGATLATQVEEEKESDWTSLLIALGAIAIFIYAMNELDKKKKEKDKKKEENPDEVMAESGFKLPPPKSYPPTFN